MTSQAPQPNYVPQPSSFPQPGSFPLSGESPQPGGPPPPPPAAQPGTFAPAAQPAGRPDSPQRVFTAILLDTPPASPKKLYYLLGACAVVAVLGLIYTAVKPEKAKAKTEPAAPDHQRMTEQELAKDAGVLAARELARRMSGEGNPASQAAAADAIRRFGSPRLARNLSLALAAEQQKRHARMMVQIERETQASEGRRPAPDWPP